MTRESLRECVRRRLGLCSWQVALRRWSNTGAFYLKSTVTAALERDGYWPEGKPLLQPGDYFYDWVRRKR